jgi:signal transduction histidine kinase
LSSSPSEEDLVAALRRVAGGDLGTPLGVDGPPAAIADAFNAMLTSLRRHDDELHAASVRIASASDARRRAAERELHDGVQQHLALVALKLSILKGLVRRDPAEAEAMCAELGGSLQGALRELRLLAHWIYPAILENEGLPAALRDAALRYEIRTEFEYEAADRYEREIEAIVYFCVLEALENAGNHAGTGVTVSIQVIERDGSLHFSVSDDGLGFDPGAGVSGTGLQHVADRVSAHGGTLDVRSAPGTGTRIRGSVPLRRA